MTSGKRNFIDAYQVFTRVVNRLQRKYLELRDETDRQARELAEANQSLRKLSLRNRAITEFLNSILASVTSGIVVIDSSGKITHFNTAAEGLFGVSSGEALNKPYAEIIKSSEKGRLSAPDLLEGGVGPENTLGVEKSLVCGKRVRQFLCGVSPLTDASGRVFGAVEVFQDISELGEMRREMARMETLAAVGEMAASVAHQVRNPLVSVKGFASLIARGTSDGQARERASSILKGVEHLERVIDALLRFSRKEALNLKPTNLCRYLRKVVRQFNERESGKASQDSPVTFDGPLHKINAEIDQIVFREIVQNILQNARESCERPVAVTVELRGPAHDPHDLIDRTEPGRGTSLKVEILIRDNGPGIPTDHLQDIFRPFFTTKTRGSGLGLALARKMIIAHGGSITAQSSPSSGSAFHILLPVRKATMASESTT
ncbi:MAG: nitrogen regulation protein NR(II) [Candidatus Zixiibacteriota bacterium]